VKALGRGREREHWSSTRSASTLGVVYYFREIVVVDDRFGGGGFLPKMARHIAKGSIAGVILCTKARGRGQQEHS
jgi:hypothetical protein